MLGDLLDAHPNLHVDLSWAAFDQVTGQDGWRGVVERHPDRFVVGSDAIGDVEHQPRLLSRWADFTCRLLAGSRLVEHENVRRLWWPSVAA